MTMSILIKKSGILTTVQDFGRNGFRASGINPNGAMDKTAVCLINILLGNDENEAVLEMHFPAPEIEFAENALIAIGGADFAAKIGETIIENWRPVFVEKGAKLKFTEKVFGNRAYLTIKGGIKTEKYLNSASTNLKAGIGEKLKNGNKIEFKQSANNKEQDTNYKISDQIIPFYSRFPTVRVTTGADFQRLTKASKETLSVEDYKIMADSDRMGFRLEGAGLVIRDKTELLSSAVDFGTIQLLPDGQMIILMADHQTTGGYPRIAHIVPTDLPLVAQLDANDKIAFKIVTQERAEELVCKLENDLTLLKIGAKYVHG